MQRAIAGESQAVDQLVAAALPSVLAWCMRLGGPSLNHEDAAHDAIIVMIKRLHTLVAPEAFTSWLYQITRKVVAGHRRKAWFRRWLPIPVPDEPDPSHSPERTAEASQVGEAVWAALDALPPAHREVLVLCDLEERADSEVAQMLGVPKGTVKSRLRRARIALRGHLEAMV